MSLDDTLYNLAGLVYTFFVFDHQAQPMGGDEGESHQALIGLRLTRKLCFCVPFSFIFIGGERCLSVLYCLQYS